MKSLVAWYDRPWQTVWRIAMLLLVANGRGSRGLARNRAFFRFQYPLLAAAVALALSALYSYPYASNSAMAAGLQAYLSWYARMVGSVISAIDSHVVVSGNHIIGPMFSMSIVQTCDARMWPFFSWQRSPLFRCRCGDVPLRFQAQSCFSCSLT